MNIIDILTIALPAIFSGGVLTYAINKRRENRNDFKVLIEAYKEDNKELRRREEENRKLIISLQNRIAELEMKVKELSEQLKKYTDGQAI